MIRHYNFALKLLSNHYWKNTGISFYSVYLKFIIALYKKVMEEGIVDYFSKLS